MNISKVWVIVYRKNSGLELLLLKPNPEPGLSYDYYVITGDIEPEESAIKAVERETYEEIGLKPINISDINEIITYKDRLSKKEIAEQCFVAEVGLGELKLNEEHIGYKWVNLDDFEKSIWWKGSKAKLKQIINKLPI